MVTSKEFFYCPFKKGPCHRTNIVFEPWDKNGRISRKEIDAKTGMCGTGIISHLGHGACRYDFELEDNCGYAIDVLKTYIPKNKACHVTYNSPKNDLHTVILYINSEKVGQISSGELKLF